MNQGAHRQYSQVQVRTANKGQLIVMLYQGTIRFMKKALLLIEKKDMEGKGNCLIRAQDIILELLYSIDQKMLDGGNSSSTSRAWVSSFWRNPRRDTELEESSASTYRLRVNAWVISYSQSWPGRMFSYAIQGVTPASRNLRYNVLA